MEKRSANRVFLATRERRKCGVRSKLSSFLMIFAWWVENLREYPLGPPLGTFLVAFWNPLLSLWSPWDAFGLHSGLFGRSWGSCFFNFWSSWSYLGAFWHHLFHRVAFWETFSHRFGAILVPFRLPWHAQSNVWG